MTCWHRARRRSSIRSMPGLDLSGLRVLVTRPREQASDLIRAIEAAGGGSLLFPALEIHPVTNLDQLAAQIRAADEYHWIIFVSANAVRYGLPVLRQAGIDPDCKNIAAVGLATAKSLREQRIGVTEVPSQSFNSEALAALPAFQNMAGQHVLIMRGRGGRDWLRDTLRQRGAQVDYAECYLRCRPSNDPRPVLTACQQGNLDLVVSTSSQGLENLMTLVAGDPCVVRLPLLLIGERQAREARRLHWQGRIIMARDPRTTTIVDSIIAQRDHW